MIQKRIAMIITQLIIAWVVYFLAERNVPLALGFLSMLITALPGGKE